MNATGPGCPEIDSVFDELDPVRAVDFLECRACDLRHALARPDHPDAIASLRDRQAASHEGWLNLIALMDRAAGSEAAEQLATLYGFHGRAAACLERGLDPRLDPHVAARVRVQLLTELQDRTATAVSAVLDGASPVANPA